jgi:uncharacterized protein YdhG (YjbR/CyaY superfamily)
MHKADNTVKNNSVKDYINNQSPERQEALNKLQKLAKTKLTDCEECIQYNMPSYVLSLKTYPNGYHCTPNTPLPFVSFASQKNFIALYHMGLYANPTLLEWFTTEYPKHCKSKLDMGKSCIRFKKIEDIPYKLIEELFTKMNGKQWIKLYESVLKK